MWLTQSHVTRNRADLKLQVHATECTFPELVYADEDGAIRMSQDDIQDSLAGFYS